MLEFDRLRVFPLVLLLVAPLGISACSDQAMMSRGAPEFYDEEGPPGASVDDDDDDTAGDDDDSVLNSGVHLTGSRPAAGSSDHFYRDIIQLEFSGYAASASVSLFDEDSYSVPSQLLWSEDMTTCQLWPTEALQPDSPYRVVVELGDAAVEFEFSTSLFGTPVPPENIDGRAYALDFTAAESVDAPLLAKAIRAAASQATWLVQPSVESSGLLALDIAFALSGDVGFEQSLCASTTSFGAAENEIGVMESGGSYFWAEGPSLSLPIDDREFVFEDWSLDGDFSPEGDLLFGVGFSGNLRADSLGLASENDACVLAQDEFGSLCQPCTRATTNYCIPVSFGRVSGGEGVQGIVSQTVDDDSNCEGPSSGLLSCSLSSGPGATGSVAGLLFLSLVGFIRRR